MRRSTIIGAVLIGGLALAGCTPAEAPSDQPPSPGTPPSATAQQHAGQHEAGEHSETDREFAQQLLANRKQVVELAQLAQSNGQGAETKALATQLQQSAQLQVTQLDAFLASAAGQPSDSGPADATDAQGLQTQQQLDQLKQLQGAQFDQQWKQAVQALEQSAGQLARSEQEEGQAQAMRKLAEDFVANQQDVLTKLTAL
ncbi:DUF305 domain-containing protein [Saccharopolyspora sp. NPDC002376]